MKTVLAKKSAKTAPKNDAKKSEAPKGKAVIAPKAEAKTIAPKGEHVFTGVTVGMNAALLDAGIYSGCWEHKGGISDAAFSAAYHSRDAWLAAWNNKEKGTPKNGVLFISARCNLAMRAERKGDLLKVWDSIKQRGIVAPAKGGVCTVAHLVRFYGKENVRFIESLDKARKELASLKFPKHAGGELLG